jgi:hypothetical protein
VNIELEILVCMRANLDEKRQYDVDIEDTVWLMAIASSAVSFGCCLSRHKQAVGHLRR